MTGPQVDTALTDAQLLKLETFARQGSVGGVWVARLIGDLRAARAETADQDERAELWRAKANQAEAQVTAVRALHSPVDRGAGPNCAGCATHVTHTPYEKCKTIAALDGATPLSAGAAPC